MTIGKNHRPLYYYLLAWLIVFLGGMLASLRLQGYLGDNFLTVHLFQFSYILESLILSLGLGDHIIRQRVEKEMMQAETIRLLEENQRMVNTQNQQLETLVRERTDALHASNEELTQNNEELKISYEKLDTQSQALQQLNATKDRLFAIIGHDLRAPIHSLKGLMELVEAQKIAPSDFFNLTSKLRNSVEYVHFTLNNLLHWANAQMQGLTTQPKEVCLHTLATENCLLLQDMALLKNILIHNQIDPKDKVFADPDHLKLIFRNLLGNALKFTPPGGQVWLKAKSEAGLCVVEVKDTGLGIAPETITRVFKTDLLPSLRGTAGEKGTGLGLALCQEFVRKNGGNIWVESEVSQGTTFYFTLPLSPTSLLS
ncbi:MAG: HAMP domain-containing histidine kinase [Microscillaceae bacterium]|nr:HAMP domain-containing histidine kinase [Microscillaceae bacterium]